MHPLAVADLKRSGIEPQHADAAGLFDVDNAADVYSDFDAGPALVIPYYNIDGSLVQFMRDGENKPFCRVRYLDPKADKGFLKAKIQRYSQPGGSGTRAYFCPMIDWTRIVNNIEEPLIITEGEKKAVAAIALGFPVIALGGVFNFTNGGDELMPELASINWRGRDVYIVFDSDAVLNPNILAAEARLVDELQRKRGARCFLVRIPPDGDDKVGLDDFLLKYGPEALQGLLKAAPFLGALDAKVVSLNQEVAWIEQEGKIFDLKNKLWIEKTNFTNGSRFSAIHHITVGGKQRTEPKKISVATEWLKSTLAQRYGEILFRPGEGSVCTSDFGAPALNMWSGWIGRHAPQEGDVQPFLDFYAYITSDLPPDIRDIPLKLMAYKAQHPEEKPGIALVLLGEQGCGKTMFSEIFGLAFTPYMEVVNSHQFHEPFRPWLEKSLMIRIDEAEGEDMISGADQLKNLITEKQQPMNDKHRKIRQIQNYSVFILTSNRREVGTFSADDRRMFVINCPAKRESGFYMDYMRPWIKSGGPKKLLNYLLTLDLKGWEPPATAPMTAEKHMAYVESLTAIQALAEEMRSSNENTLKMWLDQASAWAEVTLSSNNVALQGAARATIEGINQLQIRDWYEPRELTLIFPNIIASMLGSRYDRNTPPGQLSRELRDAGVPYLQCKDNPKGFFWRGSFRQYLVVSNFDEWNQPLTQADFERLMGQWPTYAQARQKRGRVG